MASKWVFVSAVLAVVLIAAAVRFCFLRGFPSPYDRCDMDLDMDCDEQDREIVTKSVGKCPGEPGYYSRANVDGNPCVTQEDYRLLFP